MAATVVVYLTDQRVAVIDGCTGDPTIFVEDMSSGVYRDQFTITNDNVGLYFPGKDNAGDPIAQAVGAVVQAALVPTGNITIAYNAAHDTQAHLTASAFQTAITDEVAHIPPRTINTKLSYWGFPTNKNGVIMFCKFRMDAVTGWSNTTPTF